MEMNLQLLVEKLLLEYKLIFEKKNFDFDAGFEREGSNPFTPGYHSSVSIGIADQSGELIDLHIVKIWECERYFLGMPISRNILGSKVIGELLDESLEEVKMELQEYIEEALLDDD